MKTELTLGCLNSGAPWTLPHDLVTRTLAVIAMRGWGKTVAATDIAEEMCEAGLLWTAIDPIGVWWGLRANRDGTPGGYPVLIVGGDHADIQLEKDAGAKLADAVLQENICCIIDMSRESKNAVRHFVADFCDRLMDLNPAIPRHIFIEEAPELVPQKPMGEQKRSLAAVDRLIRLGRNQGYGATLISQRYATIQKDVLTQCDNLLAGRIIGKTDRQASEAWIGEVAADLFSEARADKFVKSLAGLDAGHGWFLSPQWQKCFLEIRMRQRKTYHPGATRSVGGPAPVQVQLSDVKEFVQRFGRVLSASPKTEVKHAPNPRGNSVVESAFGKPAHEIVSQQFQETISLREEIDSLRSQVAARDRVISSMRARFKPEFDSLQALFADLDSVSSNGHHVDRGVWEPWIQKLGGRAGKMVEALLVRGSLTRTQLATMTEQSPNSGSFSNNMSALNRNGLIEREGDKIKLKTI